MKNIITTLATATLLLGIAPFAFADQNVTLPDGSVYDCTTQTQVSGTTAATAQQCSSGNIDPMTLTMPWGLTGYQTPLMKGGTSVKDSGGLTLTCYSGYPTGSYNDRCFNLTSLAYYRAGMVKAGHDLINFYGGVANALANAPEFAYWINQAAH